MSWPSTGPRYSNPRHSKNPAGALGSATRPAVERAETVGAYERPLSFTTTTTGSRAAPMLFSAS